MSEQIYPIEHACSGLSQAASKLIGYAKQLAKQQKDAGMHFSAGCIYRDIAGLEVAMRNAYKAEELHGQQKRCNTKQIFNKGE